MNRLILALFLGSELLARAAAAQGPGQVAALEGKVERGRAGIWSAMQFGTDLRDGDDVRTDASGRVQIVLRDGSVVNVGRSTSLRFAEIASPTGGARRTLLDLRQGSLRPVVVAQSAGHSFEVKTPTAIAAARGTEFVIVYNPVVEVSEVVGVADTVEVTNALAHVRGEARVTTRQLTSVSRGKPPTAPRTIPDELFRQYIDGLQFIGGGTSESLAQALPLMSGDAVPPPNRAGAQGPQIPPGRLDLTTPGEFAGPPEGSAAGEAGQPPASVSSPGGVGIRF
jgi:FecR protein